MGSKPINSIEGVQDGVNYHKNLLSLYNFTGDFSRSIGKGVAQAIYTLTREPKTKDKSKGVPNTHKFIQYILNTNNGEISFQEICKYCALYKDLKRPLVSLYDTTVITRQGKKIETTIGQLLVNKIVFNRFWDNKHIPYYKVLTKGKFDDVMRLLHQLSLEKKVQVEDIKRTVDLQSEFFTRLSSVFNPSVTSDMLNTDKKFRDKRDKILNKYKDKILKDNDIELMNLAIAEVIEMAKEHYKDNDMYELYESSANSGWNKDFAAMQISLGALQSLKGDKANIIFDALSDGVPLDIMADAASSAMAGAIDRGIETQYAGEQFKNITNSMQSTLGIRGDCKSKEGGKVNETDPILLYNRYVLNKDGTTTKITTDNVQKFLGKDIILRDPLHCKQKGGNFCSTCVGDTPFDTLGTDVIALGLYITELASRLLNLFMKSTHDMSVKVFNINNFNEFIYPKLDKPLFINKIDPLDKIEKIYVTQDIELKIPKSAIKPIDTSYQVLAHGSIITIKGREQQHAIILGTEVFTTPFEIIKPDTSDNDDTKHYVFKYNEGDIFINSTKTLIKPKTVYLMLKLYLKGVVSNLIPLEAHQLTLKNTFKTNVSLVKNSLSVELLLATLSRDAKNPTLTARETGTKDYIFIGTDDLTAITNTFNGMIGPDASRAVFIGMSKSYEEQTKAPSPLEKAFQS